MTREHIHVGTQDQLVEVCIDDQDYLVPVRIMVQGTGRVWMTRQDVKELRKALKQGLRDTKDVER